MNLQDKIVVVTGAASGIGKAAAGLLAAQGARVVVADIDEQRGEAAAAELRAHKLVADYVRVDLTDPASIEAFARTVLERYGTVDVLVNGAGWGKAQPFW